MAPKSLLDRLGEALTGEDKGAQEAEAARQEAERLRQEAEAKAAEAQRQLELQAQADQEARLHREMEEAARGLRAQAGRTYVVQSGDTLSDIAQAMYGDAGRWPEIFEANKDKLSDPNLIHPGQELRIP
ncbi:MAG: LysM peptidoglycan-binding domain-containing protein [Chloroflexi bacterium]|nr:LysM peptidoglycan-binding domain-containing protein [Chloroflexota bacterium]